MSKKQSRWFKPAFFFFARIRFPNLGMDFDRLELVKFEKKIE